MSASTTLIKIAVISALPLLACFGYYSAERLSSPTLALSVAAVLAAPLALIGLAFTLNQLPQRPRRTAPLLASILAFLAPAIFLILVWS